MVPKDFGNLGNLTHLNLAFNKVPLIPKSFQLLENLEFLDLYMVICAKVMLTIKKTLIIFVQNEIEVIEANLALLPKYFFF